MPKPAMPQASDRQADGQPERHAEHQRDADRDAPPNPIAVEAAGPEPVDQAGLDPRCRCVHVSGRRPTARRRRASVVPPRPSTTASDT